MLQTFSKCEVGVGMYNLTATQILREIKFWGVQKMKNVIIGTYRGFES